MFRHLCVLQLTFLSMWSACAHASQVTIPVSDPIYEYLDRLEAYNCAYSTLRVFGPQTHADLISTVYVTPEQDRCEAPEWLLKERQILTRPIYAVRGENRSVVIADDFLHYPGMGSSIAPIVPMRAGRETVAGFSNNTEFAMASASQTKFVNLGVSLRPGWMQFVPQNGRARGKFYLQEGFVKLGYGWSELIYGRMGLRFGQTKHGSLLHSAAAAPMDMLQYRLRPVVPGFASFLGPVSFEAWWARQDTRGLATGSSYFALQLSMRPKHWLEFGWTEVFQFGGSTAQSLGAGDFASMLLYLNSPKLQARRERAMAMHLGFWLPQRTAKIYGQTLFSDLHSNQDFSYLLGLWFPRIGNSQVRVEWVETGKYPYRQNLFPGGFSYERSPLGHPLGPSARGLYLDTEFVFFDGWRFDLGANYESRGRELFAAGGAQSPETRWGSSLTVRKRFWELELEGSVLYQNVLNADYETGIVVDSVGGAAKISYSFL